MAVNLVNWFEIYVTDINRAAKFYEQVLQVVLSDLPAPPNPDGSAADYQMKAFPAVEGAPGASGSLVQSSQVQAGGNSSVIYFSSADVNNEQSRVADAGGKVLMPKTAIGPYGFISLCSDTEGNTFGLHSML